MFWTLEKGNNNDDNNNNELRMKQQKKKKDPIFFFRWLFDHKCLRIACRCLSIHGKQLLLIRYYWIFHEHRFMFPGRKWAANCLKSSRFQWLVGDVEMIKFYGLLFPLERFGIFQFIYLNKLIVISFKESPATRSAVHYSFGGKKEMKMKMRGEKKCATKRNTLSFWSFHSFITFFRPNNL